MPATIDYEGFRQRLAGLLDPDRKGGVAEKETVKHSAVRFVTVLCHLFGEDLDRKTLWSRIDSALVTAHAKTSDDDLDRFASLCLEHVQADPGKAAACGALSTLYAEWQAWPPEIRHSFLGYIATHRYPVLAHGRARWEQVKEGKVDL